MVNKWGALSDDEAYARLTRPGGGPPRWPEEDLQRRYTGRSGPGLVALTRRFTAMLASDGAFVPGWRGLDYGAGFGRIAAIMLAEGAPEQLDLADAWDRTIALLRAGGFQNRIHKTSDLLREGELPADAYDFIYSFSVFTHLAEDPFWHNLAALRRSLKPGGRLYFTVRHEDFLDNAALPLEVRDALRRSLGDRGFGYAVSQKGAPTEDIYGDSLIEEGLLRRECEARFGGLRGLGPPPYPYQHLYAIARPHEG